jgi:5-methylcytosine-specific restriction protein A
MPKAPPRFSFGKPATPRKDWNHGGKTRQQRGYGRQHERIREELLRTVILCEHCRKQNRVTPGSHADHIVPLAKGGSSDRSNYQLLCASCHALKSIRDQDKNPRLIKRKRIGRDGWPIEE